MKNIFFITLFLTAPLWLAAQQSASHQPPELNSDRPDRGQSPAVIPQHTIQIETGFQFQKDRSSALHQQEYVYPNLLLRLGLFSRAELRVNFDYEKEWEKILPCIAGQETEKQVGFDDVRLETKINLYNGNGLLPQIGILGAITLPVGNKAFRPPHVAPGGTLLFSHEISQKVELQYNIGYQKQRDQEDYRGQSFYTLSSTVSLTNKLKTYLEIFGQKPHRDQAEHNLDIGFLLLLLPNLQLDVIGGWGLNEAAPDYFAGGGLTWRLPR